MKPSIYLLTALIISSIVSFAQAGVSIRCETVNPPRPTYKYTVLYQYDNSNQISKVSVFSTVNSAIVDRISIARPVSGTNLPAIPAGYAHFDITGQQSSSMINRYILDIPAQNSFYAGTSFKAGLEVYFGNGAYGWYKWTLSCSRQ